MQIARQDITGGIFIAIQLTSTGRARVPSDREIFGDQRAAAATGLRRIARGDLDDSTASLFRFACTQSCERSPGSIQNTLIQPTLRGSPIGQKRVGLFVFLGFGLGTHVFDLKILKHQCAILADQATCCFVQEILPTVPRLARQARQLTLGTSASVAPTRATSKLLVRLLDLFLGGAVDAGIVNADTVGEKRIRFQAKIDPDLLGRGMEGQRGIEGVLDAEADRPLVAILLDGAGFDRALDGAMHHHLEVADFGEV